MSQAQYKEDEFNKLQHKLVFMWNDIGSNVDAQEEKRRTVVFVPSFSVHHLLTLSVNTASTTTIPYRPA
jgi:hypothetical protein